MRVMQFFKYNDNTHYMPIIWLSLGDQLIIIGKYHQIQNKTLPYANQISLICLVSIFLLNTFVYKRLAASGRSFSIRSRIVIGMIAATLAMCMAGTVEIFRQKSCDTHSITQTIGLYSITILLFSSSLL